MIFSTSLAKLIANTGILSVLAYYGNPTSVTIYGGTKPTAAQIIASWPSYNSASANYLVHYTSCYWTCPGSDILVQMTGKPGATIADHSGVATWCIIWDNTIYSSSMGYSSVPSLSFCVGDCSGPSGPGVVRFADTTCTQGVAQTILDTSISVVMT